MNSINNIASNPYYDRLNLLLESSKHETGRGRALIIASLIEEMLEEILRSYLLPIKETKNLFESPNAPLSTLSAKAGLARSLNLITGEEYKNINTIRKIRNEFAHNVLCSFEQKNIENLASSLSLGMSSLDALPKGDKSRVTSAKMRFDMVSISIVMGLYNRAHETKKNRVREK